MSTSAPAARPEPATAPRGFAPRTRHRWRLPLLLGWRDVTGHKLRTALVVVTVALATAIVGLAAGTIARVLTPGAGLALSSRFDERATASIDDATVGVLLVAGALGLVQTLVLVAPAFLISLRRRTRELGLLTAAGARDSDIRRIVLGPALVSALLGVLIGGPVALALVLNTPGLTAGEVGTAALAVAGVMALNVVLATLAAWIPARRTLQASSIAALTGRSGAPAGRSGHEAAWAIGALVAAAGGTVLALSGAGTVSAAPMVIGVTLAEAGVLVLIGTLLVGLGRLPIRGLVAAYVLRDAARARTRVLPAIAAGTIIVAAATAALAYSATMHAEEATRSAALNAPVGSAFMLLPDDAPDAAETLTADAGQLGKITSVTTVTAGRLPSGGPGPQPAIGPNEAPAATEVGSMLLSSGPLVADEQLVRALDLGTQALDAVAAGRVLVAAGQPLAADGTVHLYLDGHAIDAPATKVAALGRYTQVMLTPEATRTLGLTLQAVGAVVVPATPFTAEDGPRVSEALGPLAYVELGPPAFGDDGTGYVLAAFGALAVLAVTTVMSSLAAQETRTDRRTLETIGAAPRTARKIAGAQAGLIATAAAWTGVPAGIALATLFLTAQHSQTYLAAGPTLNTTAPVGPILALLLGLPLVVACLGALTAQTATEASRRLG